MPQRILLIAEQDEPAEAISSHLIAQGYPFNRIRQPERVSRQTPSPALCIVDLALLEQDEQRFRDWVRDCAEAQTACLGYHSSLPADRTRLALLEPQTDILLQPGNPAELLTKVANLLTIRKLSRQLTEARRQLAVFQQDLQEALQSAALIQRSLIPGKAPQTRHLNFAWRFMPCKKVGGDLFNVTRLDENTMMVYMVDVSGHGISSAMVTVSVHQSLSSHTGQVIKRPLDHPPFYQIAAPKDVLAELETEYPFERFEEFFTISYLLIDPHSGVVRYCNAGHPPPILLRRGGHIERLTHGGTVIGLGHLVDFEEGTLRLEDGDRLYLYTDGITEYADPTGQVYGEGRFIQSLQALTDKDLDNSCQAAIQQMRNFGKGALPQDDVTLLGIEFSTTGPSCPTT